MRWKRDRVSGGYWVDTEALRSERIKAALQEYVIARQELILHIGSYTNQANHLRIAIGLLIIIVPGIFGLFYTPTFAPMLEEIKTSGILACSMATIVFTISAITYLIVFQVCENQFNATGHSQRIAIIETRLNELLGEPIFVWESQLYPKIWSEDNPVSKRHPFFWSRKIVVSLIVIFGNVLPFFLYCTILYKHQGQGRGVWWVVFVFVAVYMSVTIAIAIHAVRSGNFAFHKAANEIKSLFSKHMKDLRKQFPEMHLD